MVIINEPFRYTNHSKTKTVVIQIVAKKNINFRLLTISVSEDTWRNLKPCHQTLPVNIGAEYGGFVHLYKTVSNYDTIIDYTLNL